MQSKILAMIIIAIALGPIISLLITPLFCLFRKMFFVPFIRKKLVRKATEKGHVVTATLGKSGDIITEHGELGFTTSGKMAGTYHYEYRGKRYTHRLVGTMRLPEQITLYFQKKPSKATTEDQLGLRESNWLLYFVVISAVVSLCVYIAEVMIYA